MKRAILLLFVLTGIGFAQKIDLDAIKLKSDSYMRTGEYDKGIKYLQGILKKNVYLGDVWDDLASFYQIKADKELRIELTMDDLQNMKLMEKKLKIAIERPDFHKLIYTARYGAAAGYGSTWCEIILRTNLVDHPVDTGVTDEALEYFDDAEKEFGNRNYDKAISYYKKAIEAYPDFYKANLYLGDTYYALKDWKNAIEYFKESIKRQPDLLEPRKYLVDAYYNAEAYDEAMEACIEGICVYPDLSMMLKVRDIHEALGKKFELFKVIRTELPGPNDLDNKQLKQVVKVKTDKNSMWVKYKEGLEKFKEVNGVDEIVYNKEMEPLQYREIEAWRYMSQNSNAPALDEARKFDADGYLDCFVMIDNFHYDFYEQFKVWVSYNKERVRTYLKEYRVQ